MSAGRTRIVLLYVSCALIAALALVSATASASVFHKVLPPEAGFGSFERPSGVAIDQADGNVFVVSGAGPEVVDVFGAGGGAPAGGAPAVLSGLHAPFVFSVDQVGIAVDSSCFLQGLNGSACTTFDGSNGDIYVPNIEGDGQVVEKFRLNASHEYEYVCQFTGYGGLTGSACEAEPARSPTTHFKMPPGVAVDSKGNVFISDRGSGEIYEFNSRGEEVLGPITTGPVPIPQALAVDANGDLFAGQYGGGAVELKHNPSGGFEPAVEIANGVYGIAVEPVHELLYLDFGSVIKEYSLKSGAPVFVSGFGEGMLGFSLGLAVNDSTGDVYASAFGEPSVVRIFSGPLTNPVVRTGGVSGLVLGGATLEGEVDPEGGTLTSCEFEYGVEGAPVAFAPCSSLPGPGEAFVAVSARIVGLKPNTPYRYRLLVEANGSRFEGSQQTFLSFKALPGLGGETAFASEVTQLTATLHGTIDPNNAPTSYRFVYGASTAYGQVAPSPDGYVPVNETDDTVAQQLVGLTPGTVYHFALIANSPAGTTVGPDETFTTPPVPVAAVMTGGVSEVGVGTATLSGSIDPRGWQTSYQFQYGTSTAYGALWPTVPIALGSFTGAQGIVATVQNLQPGTLYHYRLVASNPGGTSYGTDQTLTTSEYPVSIIQQTTQLKGPFGIDPERPTTKTLTGAQRLANTLRACKKHKPKHERAKCEKQARKNYGHVNKKK
jgi:hypothetical protein